MGPSDGPIGYGVEGVHWCSSSCPEHSGGPPAFDVTVNHALDANRYFLFSKPHDSNAFPPRTSSRWLSFRQRLALFIAPWLREDA